MTEQTYIRVTDYLNNKKALAFIIRLYAKAVTWVTVVAYVGFLIYEGLVLKNYQILYHSILVPLVGFLVVSFYRTKNHSMRPYEMYGFTPIISKDTVGKSFPSRHVFSIFIIAATFAQVSIPFAIITALLGILLGVCRVVGGVHFPKDVISGALIGVLSGAIGYGLLYLI